VTTTRQKIVTAARWGIDHEPQIHYGELRPVPLARALPLTTDCSGFVTLCYFLAGAPDPNGLGYSGEGWTGTLLRNLARIDRAAARRGDLVLWGAYPGHHVAVVLEPGDDPLLASHGQERGPTEVRFSVEDAWQRRVSYWLDGLTRSSRPPRR
jgi:cell wall-associated NlpC family hydrolase